MESSEPTWVTLPEPISLPPLSKTNKQPPVLEQFETTDVKLLSNHIIELSLGNEPMITRVLSKESTIRAISSTYVGLPLF